jgi:hypothetical protein
VAAGRSSPLTLDADADGLCVVGRGRWRPARRENSPGHHPATAVLTRKQQARTAASRSVETSCRAAAAPHSYDPTRATPTTWSVIPCAASCNRVKQEFVSVVPQVSVMAWSLRPAPPKVRPTTLSPNIAIWRSMMQPAGNSAKTRSSCDCLAAERLSCCFSDVWLRMPAKPPLTADLRLHPSMSPRIVFLSTHIISLRAIVPGSDQSRDRARRKQC